MNIKDYNIDMIGYHTTDRSKRRYIPCSVCGVKLSFFNDDVPINPVCNQCKRKKDRVDDKDKHKGRWQTLKNEV